MSRPRLTYANVTSSIALFLALGGTSYAVAKLPKNSVGATQIKAGAVGTSELKGGAVTGDKLAGGVALGGPRGPRGPEGPQGPAGQNGAAGPSSGWLVNKESTELSRNALSPTKITEITGLPAGSYLISFTGEMALPATTSSYGVCDLAANGTKVSTMAARIGATSAAAMSSNVADMMMLTRDSPFDLSVSCFVTDTIPGGSENPKTYHAKLAAVRLGSVSVSSK